VEEVGKLELSDKAGDQQGACHGKRGYPYFPGDTFFWLVLKLPVCDRDKETITEQTCGSDGGG
jgi:hypothetical protein